MAQQDKGDLNPPINEAWGTPLKVGDTVPSVTFKTRASIESDDQNPFDWKDVTSKTFLKANVWFSLVYRVPLHPCVPAKWYWDMMEHLPDYLT